MAKHTNKSLVLGRESCSGQFITCQRCPKDAAHIATQRLGMNLQTCCSPLGWCLLPRALLLFAPSSAQFSRITGGSELSMEGSMATHLGNVPIKTLPTQQTIFQENCKNDENIVCTHDNLRVSVNQIETGELTFVSKPQAQPQVTEDPSDMAIEICMCLLQTTFPIATTRPLCVAGVGPEVQPFHSKLCARKEDHKTRIVTSKVNTIYSATSVTTNTQQMVVNIRTTKPTLTHTLFS